MMGQQSKDNRYVTAKNIRKSGEAIIRAQKTGGPVSLEDWEVWRSAQADRRAVNGVASNTYLPDTAAVQRWQKQLEKRSNDPIVRAYNDKRVQRLQLTRQLRDRRRRAHSDSTNLLPWRAVADLPWADVVEHNDCEATAEFEQHIYPVNEDGALRSEVANPDHPEYSIFSYLEKIGAKGWNGSSYPNTCFIIAEGSTPYVVHVGEFRTKLRVPDGDFILSCRSSVHHKDTHSWFFFSEGVQTGSFSIQSHLIVEGDIIDPLDLAAAGPITQTSLDYSFGGSEALRYGFFHPVVSTIPLETEVNVLGPGTVTVKEIVNFHLNLKEYQGDGSFAEFLYFSGHFDSLCWELVKPGLLSQLWGRN